MNLSTFFESDDGLIFNLHNILYFYISENKITKGFFSKSVVSIEYNVMGCYSQETYGVPKKCICLFTSNSIKKAEKYLRKLIELLK